jgi:hypothetical protein
VVIAGVSMFLLIGRQRASGPDIGEHWPVVRREVVADVAISIRSESGAFQPAATPYVVEFKNAASGRPLDVSGVSLVGAMTMPGMTMTSAGDVASTRTRGRFVVRLSFGMSGTWQMRLAWRGAGGDQAMTFDGEVR